MPTGANVQPAVWITQPSSTTYRYASFPTNSYDQSRPRRHRGRVLEHLDAPTIEIFSVDKNGKKSDLCTYVKY